MMNFESNELGFSSFASIVIDCFFKNQYIDIIYQGSIRRSKHKIRKSEGFNKECIEFYEEPSSLEKRFPDYICSVSTDDLSKVFWNEEASILIVDI